MKKATWAAALLLMLLIVLAVGCSNDKSSSPTNDNGGVGLVQVFLPEDTLQFLPGDSASANGWVVVTDRDGNVLPNQKVTIALTQPIGYIEFSDQTRRDTTDGAGKVNFRYVVYGFTGNNSIRASVGSKVDVFSFFVQQASQIIQRLNIELSRDNIGVAENQEDSVEVRVAISDVGANGIPNVTLRLNATGGRLAALPPTDNSGRATTYWYSNGEFGDFTISCTAGGIYQDASVRVDSLRNAYGSLEIASNTARIRADRCISMATIKATLKNQNGVAIPNDTITFAAPEGGQVNAIAITDTQGVATAYFCEYSRPTPEDEPAMVIARYEDRGLSDTLYINIDEQADIGHITFDLNSRTGTAGRDSSAVTIQVYYSDDTRVSNRYLYLYKTCGTYTGGQDSVLLMNGTVTEDLFWRFCNSVTTPLSPAKLWVKIDEVTSDTVEANVIAGDPFSVRILTASERGHINEPMDVWAVVLDSLQNPVSGGSVSFETTLGNIDPPWANTQDDGMADARLNPGTQGGVAMIKATIGGGIDADSTLVTIEAGNARSINLSVTNPSPQVRGTGGNDQTQLIARVYDDNGNPVADGHWVWFEILDSPGGGCSINREGATVDSITTAGGQAMATFNSGTVAGPVRIEARTWVRSGLVDSVLYRVSSSAISIVAGPPADINLQIAQIGAEAETGDAAWDVSVVAVVVDSFSNPVRDGIAVFFSVFPDTAAVSSDSVVTGNGLGRPGTAYTSLRYISAATNWTVDVTARTARSGPNAVTETVSYKLPPQFPQVSLNCMPATWHYGVDGGPCEIECQSIVTDGYGVRINGCTVIYSASRGRFWTNTNQTQQANSAVTGPFLFDVGFCSLWMMEDEEWIFPPQTPEIPVDISVEVEGFPEAIDSQTINMRH